MSFRKETKFRLTKSDQKLLKSELLLDNMKILHPQRIVHSCYFDTKNLDLYNDSEEGNLPRKKIRIRWYNKNINLIKETKISSIEGRFKTSNSFSNSYFLKNFKYQFLDKQYGYVYPTIIVSYLREYYSYKSLRLTFDQDINYIDIKNKHRKKVFDNEAVMEIKTSREVSESYIEKIINIQPSRFSKYSRGVLKLNLVR